MPKRPDKPSGHQLTILSLLLDGDERTTRDIGEQFPALAVSSAYAALAMLQRNGFVKARWVSRDGERPTRGFTITAQGVDAYRRTAPATPSFRQAPNWGLLGALGLGGLGSDIKAGLVAGAILVAVGALIGLLKPLLLRVELWLLKRTHTAAAAAIDDFVSRHTEVIGGPLGWLAALGLMWNLAGIARESSTAECNPTTATIGAGPVDQELRMRRTLIIWDASEVFQSAFYIALWINLIVTGLGWFLLGMVRYDWSLWTLVYGIPMLLFATCVLVAATTYRSRYLWRERDKRAGHSLQ